MIFDGIDVFSNEHYRHDLCPGRMLANGVGYDVGDGRRYLVFRLLAVHVFGRDHKGGTSDVHFYDSITVWSVAELAECADREAGKEGDSIRYLKTMMRT